MVDFNHDQIAVSRQCELVDLNRSTLYYRANPEELCILHLMEQIDVMRIPYGFVNVVHQSNKLLLINSIVSK
jgi:hypothetical protein